MEPPPQRVIDQRIRNRIIESVVILSEGDEGVRRDWSGEYFEEFYDFIPYPHSGRPFPPNSALTDEEHALLDAVSIVLGQACDSKPFTMTADEFIATGWPKRIQPVAQAALKLMLCRGRFSEDIEEEEPSYKGPWP